MLTFGSLFAGIGGFDLGLERAGMRSLWQVEKDKFCQRILAKHWPDVKRYDDVCELPWWLHYDPASLAPVDLICGGFPCQPHSVAGRRQGDGCCSGNDALSRGGRLAQREGVLSGGARTLSAVEAPCRWPTEPCVGRVAHGIPSRVDRIAALGNAVVPEVVEEIGRMIVAAHYAGQEAA